MKDKRKIVSLSFPTFSQEDCNIDNLEYIISTTIESIVKNLYKILSTHVYFRSLKDRNPLKKILVEPTNFQEYKGNLVNTLEYAKTLNFGFDFIEKLKINKLKQVAGARKEYLQLLSFAIEFIDIAIRLENINEGNNPRSYIKFLTSNSSRMVNCFLDMSKVVDYPSVTNQKYGDDYKKIFDDLAKYLQSITDLVKSIISFERESRKEAKTLEKEKIMREQKSRAVEFIPSDKDVKRLSLIEQTNAFYKEFCDDFLRDLDKQYSLSSRDMYEYFINVKFKNFVERYPMPIASDASEGYAKEVFCQIQILIDYISKISENSYAISAYKQK